MFLRFSRSSRPSPERLNAVSCCLLVALALAGLTPSASAQGNDACEDALAIELGQSFEAELSSATADGSATCDGGGHRDRWYRFVAPRSERFFVLSDEQELSVHTGCPGSPSNQVACGAGPLASPGSFGLSFGAAEGETYYIRVAGTRPLTGPVSSVVVPGGVIQGTVTDIAGAPLAGVPVFSGIRNAVTDEQGRYRLSGFDSGGFMVYAGVRSPYIAELFEDIPCPFLSCLPLGTRVNVGPGSEATVDFALELGAIITGELTDELTGEPLSGQFVNLFGLSGVGANVGTTTVTGDDGRFRFEGLAPGSYAVRASGDHGYAREFWEDQPCIQALCSIEMATPVVVVGDEEITGIDFTLGRALAIRGIVRDAATGEPLSDGRVRLREVTGEALTLATIRGDGTFSFEGLLPGNYLVSTRTENYVDEIWPDVDCTIEEICPTVGATPIALMDTDVTGIDFSLEFGASVRAEVVDEQTGQRLSLVRVGLYDENGALLSLRPRSSGEGGVVEFNGLPPGSYRALASTVDFSFSAEIYADLDCPGGPESCGPVDIGTPIIVAEQETISIGFTLERPAGTCQPDLRTLCLNEGRFAVTARWRIENGEGLGSAARLPLIDDSGAFYFFNSENTELVVKVLDACEEPSNRFWVFASGLTNVEVELTVEDTLIGDKKTYFNPLGAAFQPIQDTDAFATCIDAGTGPPTAPLVGPQDADRVAAAAAELEAVLARAHRHAAAVSVEMERSAESAGSASTKANCVASASTLCLGAGGRFRVEAAWQTPDGTAGVGTAVPFRRDTGLFWFFDASNIELIVKVLDACGAPFDRFWVFAGGLTNVDVTLRVTDTVTGDVRLYQNPQGQRFEPIQDTDAFATCDAP